MSLIGQRTKIKRETVDLHCHILPGLDDGSPTYEESVMMASIAADSGVAIIVATPHSFGNESFGDEFRDTVISAVNDLQSVLDSEGIPIKLVPGTEIYAREDTSELLLSGELLTLGGTKYALIEFDFAERSRNMYSMLESVLNAGFIPVVAHPERYDCVLDNPLVAEEMVRHGCLLQVNKGSLLGAFGSDVMRSSISLVRKGLACCVASDAHSAYRRTTDMSEVKKMLVELTSPEEARQLLSKNPIKILRGETFPSFEKRGTNRK